MEVPPPKVHRHHRHRRSNRTRNQNETSSSTERQPVQQLQQQQPPHIDSSTIPQQYPISPLARVHERNQQLHQQQQQQPQPSHGNNSISSQHHPNIQIVASFHQQQPNQNLEHQDNPAVLVNGHEPHLVEQKNSDKNTAGISYLNTTSDISSSITGGSVDHAIPTINTHDNTNDRGGGGGGGGGGVSGSSSSNAVNTRNQSSEILATIRNHQNQLETGNVVNNSGNNSNIRRTMQLTPHGSPRPGSSASNIEQQQQHHHQHQHNQLQQQISLHQNVHKGIMGFMDRELLKSNTNAKKTQSLSDPQASPAQRSTRSRSSIEKSPRRKRSKSESRRRRERKLIAAGEMEVRQANETLMRYLKQVSEMNDASLSGELEIDHNFDERRVHRKTKSQRDKRGHIISKSSVSKLYAAGGGLSSILKDLSEDIVPGNEIYNPFTPVVSPTEGPPSRIDKMFIQTSSGYRPVDYYKHQIDLENNRHEINSSVNLSCALQRIWIMVSNICHGLLGGLALAHLLFIVTNRPLDWVDGAIKHYSAFAEVYANTFFCLAIICMVSIFDRMDICHIDITNASELISFRWIIIAMIYIATIILTLCAETIDEQLYLTNFNITVFEEEMENNQVLNVWNSLSIARSIGAIFGWVMIGLSPGEDLLYENLLEMEKYQLTNN